MSLKQKTLGIQAFLRDIKIDDIKNLVFDVETIKMLNHFFQCEISEKNMRTVLENFLIDKKYKNFVKHLTDETYDHGRYKDFVKYREKNPYQANTISFYEVKYGKHKGLELYNLFRMERSENNSYNPQYVARKNNISIDEANIIIQERKYKSGMSLERCIEKYGKELGTEKHKFIHRFHKWHPDFWENKDDYEKYKRESNMYCEQFYTKRGVTDKKEIEKKISEKQNKYSGLHKGYYELKGLTEEQIKLKFKNINKLKDGSSLKFYIKKYGIIDGPDFYKKDCLKKGVNSLRLFVEKYGEDEGYTRYVQNCKRLTKLYTGFDLDLFDKNTNFNFEYKQYRALVKSYTKKSLPLVSKCPGVRGNGKDCFHLDHKFSIRNGYFNKVHPKIIGCVFNLEWLPSTTNIKKGIKNSITLEQLLEKYNENN